MLLVVQHLGTHKRSTGYNFVYEVGCSSFFISFSAADGEIFGRQKDEGGNGSPTVDNNLQPTIFALKTSDRKIYMKAAPNAHKNEIHEWLYAFNPLMAGEIR